MINIKLDEKKTSVSIRYNAYYKLVILLAIIKNCGRGNKASLQLIHLLFWALRDDKNYRVMDELKQNKRNSLIPWSFEFGLEKVLSIGYIEEYIDRKIVGGMLEIVLTSKGLETFKSIDRENLFNEEINKIKAIGYIPKVKIEKANKNWELI